jgi:hypothetical protein
MFGKEVIVLLLSWQRLGVRRYGFVFGFKPGIPAVRVGQPAKQPALLGARCDRQPAVVPREQIVCQRWLQRKLRAV